MVLGGSFASPVRGRCGPLANELAIFARDVQVSFSPAARSREVAAFARGALALAQIANRAALGRVPSHRTYVDGRAGGALETVRPNGGTIEFEFDFIDPEILRWISEKLHENSPVRSGRYKRSHVLLADGIEIDPIGPIPQAKIYEFVSTVIYAKKIERGLSPQAPDGVFQVVAVLAQRRSNLDISFAYQPRSDAIAPSRKFGRFTDAGYNWSGSQPAIIVKGYRDAGIRGC